MALFASIKLPARLALGENWNYGVVLGGDFVWVYFLNWNCFSLKTDLTLGLKVCLWLPWSGFQREYCPWWFRLMCNHLFGNNNVSFEVELTLLPPFYPLKGRWPRAFLLFQFSRAVWILALINFNEEFCCWWAEEKFRQKLFLFNGGWRSLI